MSDYTKIGPTITNNATINNFVIEGFKTENESGLCVYTRNGVMIAEPDQESFNWVKVWQYREHMKLKDVELERQKLTLKSEIYKLKIELQELKNEKNEK